MAACGAELLRVALSSPQVDRRLARQAGDVFVVLKDMLASLHDRHADCLSQVTGDSVNVRRARETNEELEPRPEGATLVVRPSTRWWGRRVSRSGANVRNHPYLPCNSRPESRQQHQQQQPRNSSSPGTERVNESTTDAGLAVHVPSVVGGRDPNICVEVASPANTVLATVSGSDSTAEESADSERDVSMADSSMVTIAEPDPVLDKRPTTATGRQDVIRDALLRQGLSESDITAYLNGNSKGTNTGYNYVWKRWATWCIEQGLDPVKRSEAHLTSCALKVTKPGSRRKQIKSVVRLVWWIAEGHAPPAKYQRVGQRKSGNTIHG
ncbi:hypothetical protein GGF41_002042 [Coemansia sp. RSA 2531]|nr:hypothetical protein GGF41_002042 [Coemansia sp. RSA 2531]